MQKLNYSAPVVWVQISSTHTAKKKTLQNPTIYNNIWLLKPDGSPIPCKTEVEGIKAYSKLQNAQVFDTKTGKYFLLSNCKPSTKANPNCWDPFVVGGLIELEPSEG